MLQTNFERQQWNEHGRQATRRLRERGEALTPTSLVKEMDVVRGEEMKKFAASGLTERERRMIELQNDPVQVKDLANIVLGTYVSMVLNSTLNPSGISQQNLEGQCLAVGYLFRLNPGLEEAYTSGHIAPDDWNLLGILWPSTGGGKVVTGLEGPRQA